MDGGDVRIAVEFMRVHSSLPFSSTAKEETTYILTQPAGNTREPMNYRSLSSSELISEEEQGSNGSLFEPLPVNEREHRLEEEWTESIRNETEESSDETRGFLQNHFQTPSRNFTRSPVRFFQERFKAGSVKGSIFTLIVSIVGAGSLSVPFAVEKSGYVHVANINIGKKLIITSGSFWV